jgi:hypothetical protein
MGITRSRSPRLCLTVIAIFTAGLAGSLSRAGDAPVVLENSQVLLEIDPAFGVISHILDKSSGIALAPVPALAENFRLVLLMPDKTTATIMGKHQKLSGVSRTVNGLVLKWYGPLKDAAGAEHKIAVRMNVNAVGSELQFGLHVDNGSACKVREAWCPMIGGLSNFGAPGKPADGTLWIPANITFRDPNSGIWTKKIELPFGAPLLFPYPGAVNLNAPNPWGPGTAQMSMSFTCVQSATANRSLYFASHDTIARYKVYQFGEHARDNAKDVFACIRHFPFTPPGKAFDGATVVMRVVDGDWRAAGRVYRAWYEKNFGISKPSENWIRRESFFQFTMFKLPEGTVLHRFKDIPQWAKDAKDHGINSVQISGWNVGGHDNGYPNYAPDLQLGTWKELEDGIKACHQMGVKVYFFVNYQSVMLQSDWYKNELNKYREWGPNGEPTWCHGYGMATAWARMNHPKILTWVDPAFPQYRKILVDQFVRLAQIGADGVHVDKMVASPMDYNPDLALSPDAAPWEGAVILTKEILAACRKYNPDWAMSFECYNDLTLRFSGATWWFGNQRLTKFVFPENAEMQAIVTAYDYLGVNNAVRDGNTVMLGPMNFCQSVGWEPFHGLADYVKEVKRIRDSLTDTVYLGELLGHEGVNMLAPSVEYNVFRNMNTGKRVCILTNATMQLKKQVIVAFEASPSERTRIHTPFQPAKVVKLPAEIEVPAERIVFVEEL